MWKSLLYREAQHPVDYLLLHGYCMLCQLVADAIQLHCRTVGRAELPRLSMRGAELHYGAEAWGRRKKYIFLPRVLPPSNTLSKSLLRVLFFLSSACEESTCCKWSIMKWSRARSEGIGHQAFRNHEVHNPIDESTVHGIINTNLYRLERKPWSDGCRR